MKAAEYILEQLNAWWPNNNRTSTTLAIEIAEGFEKRGLDRNAFDVALQKYRYESKFRHSPPVWRDLWPYMPPKIKKTTYPIATPEQIACHKQWAAKMLAKLEEKWPSKR